MTDLTIIVTVVAVAGALLAFEVLALKKEVALLRKDIKGEDS